MMSTLTNTGSQPPKEWDRETDLLVAGAGPAGLTAALAAAIEGLDVILCEKSDQVGGTGATSAGTLWIPGNRLSRDAGYHDTTDKAATYLDSLTSDPGTNPLREVFLRDGPDMIDYLVSHSELSFTPCGLHPDYRNNQPGAALEGRAIIPEPFDARQLGEEVNRIRPPIAEYMVLGGMMLSKADIDPLVNRYRSPANFTHATRLVLRHVTDRLRYRRGTRLTMGNALIGRLFFSLLKRNVPVLFETCLAELTRENDRVTGAVLQGPGGRQRVRAKRGVVCATGGFAHNEALRTRYMPEPVRPWSMAVPENQGDGITAAEAVNARIRSDGHKSSGFWSPVSVTRRKDGSRGLYPHILLDRAKPGLIAVNAAGRRFVNEAVSYHDFVEGMLHSHETVNTMPAWLVCDSRFVRKYGLGSIYPGTRRLKSFADQGYIVLADTVSDLAARIDVNPAGLMDTVERHQRYAESGSDPDFGKGDDALNRFNGDPDHEPNPCLGPIATPPFVAIAVWPAEIGCSIGLETNVHGEVIDTRGEVLKGLYACGNDMSSIMAGTYAGPGITLGPAIVFACRIARHASGTEPEHASGKSDADQGLT